MRNSLSSAVFRVACCAVLYLSTGLSQADEPENPVNPRERVELPGITIDVAARRVDVDAKVSLNEGLLELVACTPDSKEHEALVTVDASPVHIHAALLLIGAQNGEPAKAVPLNEAKTRWRHLPPRGDRIGVSLVFEHEPGEVKAYPIGRFIKPSDAIQDDPIAGEADEDAIDPIKVFASFLFTGSLVVADDEGVKTYVADETGHVVTISTFGDEVLGLPTIQTQDNRGLAWQADPEQLPKVGTAVKLRLTLLREPQ